MRGLGALVACELFSNQLERLDLSGAASLDELHIYNNKLAYQSFYGLRSLRYVDIRNNCVKSLDLSGNTAMNFLFATENPSLETVHISEGAAYSALEVAENVKIYYRVAREYNDVGGTSWGDDEVDPWKK